MGEIYVPIEYSEVINIVPPGEEILYSTMCKMTYLSPSGSISRWISHVLLTEGGLACTNAKDKGSFELKYIPWTKVVFISGKAFTIDLGDKYPSTMDHHMVTCVLLRNPNFETEETFRERKTRFPTIFVPLLIQKKEEFLQSTRILRLTPKQAKYFEKTLRNLHKLYNKMLKKMSK